MGGLRHLTGEPGRVPVRVGVSIGDTLASLHGVIGVLMALHTHARSAQRPRAGQVIDVALYEAVFNCMESLLPEYSAFGAVREAGRQRAAGHRADQRLPLQRRRLRARRRQRRQHLPAPDAVRSAAPTWRPTRRWPTTPAAWRRCRDRRRHRRLDRAAHAWPRCWRRWTPPHVPAGRIYTVADIAADPHYAARGMLQQVRMADGSTLARAGLRAQAVAHAGRPSAQRAGAGAGHRRRAAGDRA